MPEIPANRRGAGPQRPRPGAARPVPDQSRYGAATTDPLGRQGPGWHLDQGIPVLEKGWRYDPKTRRTTLIPGGVADPAR